MRPPGRHAQATEPVPAWAGWAGVALLSSISLGLGFYDLTSRSLWLDEGNTYLVVAQKLPVLTTVARDQGWHLLPYYLLLHGVIAVFGDSATVLRAPSVVAGALTVPFLYLLSTRLGGRLAALSAGLLFVVSEPLVFWQQNARDYTFVVLFAVVGTWGGVAATQTGRIWAFAVWTVATGIGCYTHPEMFLLVPVQVGAFVLWADSNRTRLKFGVLIGAAAVALLPALANATNSSVYRTTFLPAPTHGSATEIASFLASAASTVGPVTPVNHALLGITFLLLVIGVAMLGSDLAERGCRPHNFGLALALGWSVLPMLFDWIVSETGRQAFADRYLMVSLPGVAIGVAQVLERLRPRALSLFALGYLTIFHAGLLSGNYGVQLDDYRDATRSILTTARPGDCVTFEANVGRVLYDYYVAHLTAGRHPAYHPPVQVLPVAINTAPYDTLLLTTLSSQNMETYQSRAQVAAVAPHCSRVFVLESHFGAPSGPAYSVEEYALLQHLTTDLKFYYHDRGTKAFPGSVFVETFQRIAPPG